MRPLSILSVCILFFSCSSPLQLLEDGKIEKAFKKASHKMKSGKNVSENRKVLIETADLIIQNEIAYNFPLTQSHKVGDWVRAQKNYFNTLEDIVVANNLVNGKLQNSYDQLCTQKIELDFKIADHFYNNGDNLLATHYDQLSKHHAREAYYQYQECQAYGGDRFFQDIEDKMDECVIEGRVFFISHNFKPRRTLFFQPLPRDASFDPDCDVSASFGFISFSTSSKCSSENHSKDIQVGKKVETDTSGNKIYTPIYESISATVTTTIFTVSASSTTHIYSDNITGYCFKNDRFFNNCVSDSYKEVNVSGDTRAINGCVPSGSGSSYFTKRNLESNLESAIDSDLLSW